MLPRQVADVLSDRVCNAQNGFELRLRMSAGEDAAQGCACDSGILSD